MGLSAQQAFQRARTGGRGVIGWALDAEQRKELLLQFPPKFPNVVADHVTLAAKVAGKAGLPSETGCEIIGRVDDGSGVEAMVVSIGGTTDRPDGSTYHITWSLADGRRAKESNDVLAARQWEPLQLPMQRFFDLGGIVRVSWYGDCLPTRDFPLLAEWYRQGQLNLDTVVTSTITLEQTEDAFAAMNRGETLRSVIMFEA